MVAALKDRPAPRRRLRSKGPAVRFSKLKGALEQDDISSMVAPWLDIGALSQLSATGGLGRRLAASPAAWKGRVVDLRSRGLRKSAQLQQVVRDFAERWQHVSVLVMPEANVSKGVAAELAAAMPQPRCLDLRAAPRAGSLRLLESFRSVAEVVTRFTVPDVVMPELRRLELLEDELHMHDGTWGTLVSSAPNLEELVARWHWDLREPRNDPSDELWEKLHQPPMGCWTGDKDMQLLQNLPRLRVLDLSEVYTLTDEGLRALASLPALEELTLQNLGRGVTAKGLSWLASGAPRLRRLDISRCLNAGRGCWVNRTQMTERDVADFRAARPETEVICS